MFVELERDSLTKLRDGCCLLTLVSLAVMTAALTMTGIAGPAQAAGKRGNFAHRHPVVAPLAAETIGDGRSHLPIDGGYREPMRAAFARRLNKPAIHRRSPCPSKRVHPRPPSAATSSAN